MHQNTTRSFRIESILKDSLAPSHFVLSDESHTHKGHSGVREHSQNQSISHQNPHETHFLLEISAEALNGLSRIKQHQAIYTLLADEFKTGLHSLRIRVV